MLEMMKFVVGDPCLLLLTSTGLYGGYIRWKMGNDHEILRNLKNGICNVILLNVAEIPDSLPGLARAQTQRGRQVKVLKRYDGKGVEDVCHPQGGRMLQNTIQFSFLVLVALDSQEGGGNRS